MSERASLGLPLSFIFTHMFSFLCVGSEGELVTFGSLGMVLIMCLEAALRSKVNCQEVQSPGWDSPVGIILNVSFSLKCSPRDSCGGTAERGLVVHL